MLTASKAETAPPNQNQVPNPNRQNADGNFTRSVASASLDASDGFENERVKAMRELLRRDNLEDFPEPDRGLGLRSKTATVPEAVTIHSRRLMVFNAASTGIGDLNNIK